MLPGKISLRFDGDIKGFYRQAKTKEFRTIKPTLKKKLKGFLSYHWFPEARSQVVLNAVITYFLVDSLILFEPILTL